MVEQELTFTSDGQRLVGTLASPEEAGGDARSGPVVLLLPGSGKVDRDADAKRVPLGVSRRLAAHLAAHGTASFRFDKRGIGASGGEFLTTGFHDNTSDAAAAVRLLRDRGHEVVVVGHSEGALHALALAGTGAPVEGAVLLAGAAVTGEEVLRWQGARIAETLPRPVRFLLRLFRIDPTVSQSKQLDRIAATTEDVVRVQGVRINARWLREFLRFDPAPLLRTSCVPLLAITGSDDLQVDPADVDVMAGLAAGPFDGHVVDGVNHILRAGPAAPSSYRRQAGEPLDARVLGLLTDWLLRRDPVDGVPPTRDALDG